MNLRKDVDWHGNPEIFLLRLLDRIEATVDGLDVLARLVAQATSSPAQTIAAEELEQLLADIALLKTEAPSTHQDPERNNRTFRVFVSSPSDVLDERAVASELVQQLQYDPLIRGQLKTEVVTWDRPWQVPLYAGAMPQDSIDAAGLRPETCDLVIVILWARLGTRSTSQSQEERFGPATGTEVEYRRSIAAYRRTGRPLVIVYLRSEPALVPLGSSDLKERQEQWAALQTFLQEVALDSGTVLPTINAYDSTSSFRVLLERHLREVIRLCGYAPELPALGGLPAHGTDPAINPYPGLQPLVNGDVFYGRSREVDELISLIAHGGTSLTTIIGSSGVGKSSLVFAGLLPRLRRGAMEESALWNVVSLTPNQTGTGDPRLALQRAAASVGLSVTQDLTFSPPSTEGTTPSASSWPKTLLVIDQFEEFYTSISPEVRENFLESLCRAVTTNNLRTVITLRADFLDAVLENPVMGSLLRHGTFVLSPPSIAAMYEMIVRPAEFAGVSLEPGLSEQILEDAGSQIGSLALMAYTLNDLFRKAGYDRVLRKSDYHALGGVKGAIASRATETYEALDWETRPKIWALFARLVTVNENGEVTRVRASTHEWTDFEGPMQTLVNAFVAARLLVVGHADSGSPTLEVAHEALFSAWPLLANWLASAKDDLRVLRDLDRAIDSWIGSSLSEHYLWPEERMHKARESIVRVAPSWSSEYTTRVGQFLLSELDRSEQELSNDATSSLRRAQIGERLAEIGDTRHGVGVDRDGVPELLWCSVPAGTLRLDGSANNFHVREFEISKFPVTVRQYVSFVIAEDGYHNLQWWDGLLRGAEPPTPYHGVSNHPMDSVSWYEALAFCRWLTAKLGQTISLPTEQQWQMAATGGSSKRVFPWGGGWVARRANSLESGLGRTVAVGMYPNGAAPSGALDLAGNVWEWCLNVSDAPDDIHEGESERRAVRGGCWAHEAAYCSGLFRNPRWDYAAPRSHLRGFRVVRIRDTKTGSVLASAEGAELEVAMSDAAQ